MSGQVIDLTLSDDEDTTAKQPMSATLAPDDVPARPRRSRRRDNKSAAQTEGGAEVCPNSSFVQDSLTQTTINSLLEIPRGGSDRRLQPRAHTPAVLRTYHCRRNEPSSSKDLSGKVVSPILVIYPLPSDAV